MLLKYFYDQSLAHASFLVGCQRSQVAVVLDPGRDIDQYLAMAEKDGVELIAVAETHIHADYVSGARELADRVGAKLYVSDAGPVEWKYQFVSMYDHQLLKDGDSFMIGNIKFDVMHTPGHTVDVLEGIAVGDVYRTDRQFERVSEATRLAGIVRLLSRTHQHYFPVVNAEDKMVVTPWSSIAQRSQLSYSG